MNQGQLTHLSRVKWGQGELDVAAAAAPIASDGGVATLTCDASGETHPALNEIARFVPASSCADSFGFQWCTQAATQPCSLCNVTVSRDRVFSVTSRPEAMPGETILDAGWGVGRFTEALVKTGVNILSFDFSSAVDANRGNNVNNDNFISIVTPMRVAPTRLLRRLAGRRGSRISPIGGCSYLGLDDKTNKQWAVLDTFDMHSPAHDHPQSEDTVREWFAEIGFEHVHIGRGPNGVFGREVRPLV